MAAMTVAVVISGDLACSLVVDARCHRRQGSAVFAAYDSHSAAAGQKEGSRQKQRRGNRSRMLVCSLAYILLNVQASGRIEAHPRPNWAACCACRGIVLPSQRIRRHPAPLRVSRV
ncbi:hypothetical protein BD310DRAFT_217255 [Dichomitus squalens]|uniref:Uncharacterized protein n=1 Tax=Dichomitus squalens TaxID=114155 RepID=A0A4Q9Q2E3_9APHY|nr:hypothetical protein BD310DRAFT_217255 [Dichomitus squalens]